jgi:hypothetical protein
VCCGPHQKKKLNEEKSKHASSALQNWFWPSIFTQDAEAGKNFKRHFDV